jgi:pimeloyl-ACP methyl ester carboxylesterase
MFGEFKSHLVTTPNASLFVRYGGEGPPVLLLHGHPRTSATWHRVAPQLVARGFTVVCPDLRGYGRSRGPAPTEDHIGLEDLYGDPLKIWQHWAPDIRGHGIDSGHHVAEQAPDILAADLMEFFAG